MLVQIIHGDENIPLGINLVAQGDRDGQVLQKFIKEGMVPVSYRPGEGLVVAFGHQLGSDTGDEPEEDITPTEASRWAG